MRNIFAALVALLARVWRWLREPNPRGEALQRVADMRMNEALDRWRDEKPPGERTWSALEQQAQQPGDFASAFEQVTNQLPADEIERRAKEAHTLVEVMLTPEEQELVKAATRAILTPTPTNVRHLIKPGGMGGIVKQHIALKPPRGVDPRLN